MLKHGVVDVDIRLSVGNEFSLPSEIFTCKTIVTLKLDFGFYFDLLPPEKAFLPAVETLSLSGVRFNEHHGCSFKRLLSACPVLVELLLHEIKWEYWEWSRTVSSPTLKRLTIKRGDFYGFEGSDFGSITFDTPSLVFLEYVDFVPDEYPFVNFDSLVEAKLDLVLTVHHTWNGELIIDSDNNISSNPTNLLKGLKNVQILALTCSSVEVSLLLFLLYYAITPWKNRKNMNRIIKNHILVLISSICVRIRILVSIQVCILSSIGCSKI